MSNLEIVQIPMLTDNYGYLLIDPATNETAVVDPSEAASVLKILEDRQLKLTYILNTHHHFDHTAGNTELKKVTGCKIICSHTDKSRITGADRDVREGDEVRVGSARAIVMEVPGHTIGHVAFYFPESQAVFVGDTLFSLGCGKLFEGTASQMWNSLRRLADLPPKTKVYCGHEYTLSNARFAQHLDPHNRALKDYVHHVEDKRREGLSTIPSTIEIEVAANPFMRAPMLLKAMGLPLDTKPHEAFGHMRQIKDIFRGPE
ncbi:MAG: hydroxyacylglutathione hydrolase [Alphaproteobacteria bacterium]|nr:hydroxyacylglutathione hydrolase [Alphaproteobacteria bacterium]